jgi:Protein of unknown function (DUF732)
MTPDDPSTPSHGDQPSQVPPQQPAHRQPRQDDQQPYQGSGPPNQQQPPSQLLFPAGPQPAFQPPNFQPEPKPGKPGRGRNPRRRKASAIILSTVGVLAVIIAVTTALSGGSKKPAASKSSAPPAVQAPSSSAMSSQDQQFISDMQTHFSFDSSVSTASIAQFGQDVCSSRQSGQSQTQEVTIAQSDWTNTQPGAADEMVRLAEQDICPSDLPAYTVTYVVTGNAPAGYIDPSVDYGPAGSDFTGSVPMNASDPIPSSPPSYYAINVQLSDAGGSVTCELQVDGVTISQSSAQGADQIADCEIGQDPITGAWENDNSG